MEKNILNKILENHLFLEFSMHGNTLEGVQVITEGYGFLLEKYGVIPNIGTYTHTALNYFKPQIKGIKDKKIIHLTENIFSNIDNCFFENVNIMLEYTYSDKLNGANADTRFLSVNSLNMRIYITSDYENFDQQFLSIFAHELMHVYENYQRIKNNDKHNGLINALKDDGYFKNREWHERSGNINDDKVKYVRYFLTKPEMNAYINNIKQEIDYFYENNFCSSTKEVISVIENTTTFKNIEMAFKIVLTLINETDTNNQNNIVEMWNKYTNKPIKNFNQLRKVLYYTYIKRYRRFITKLCKMAYDVYDEYHKNSTFPSTTGRIKSPY